MLKTETGIIEYLSKVFKRLSVERKDYVLNVARSLLQIQDTGICHTFVEEAIEHKDAQDSEMSFLLTGQKPGV